MRAALYARVSTNRQECEMQLQELRSYAAKRGWEVLEYVDWAYTGKNDKRPEFQRLKRDARARKFDVVLVWHYDRFARSTTELVNSLDEFSKLGIDFRAHIMDIDTTTPVGKMVFTFVAGIAEFEHSMIVTRVRSGMAYAKARGIAIGHRRGQPNLRRDGKRVQNPYEPIDTDRVLAFHRDNPGHSIRRIAADLRINRESVRRILKAASA